MKKIIFQAAIETISLDMVRESLPIFAKREGKFMGMVVLEEKGWILRLGGMLGCSGHHETLEVCLKSAVKHNYEFFIERQ